MDDETNVALTRTDQKFGSLGLVEFVKLHARLRRIHLQIEGSRLGRLLFFACQARKAVRECIGDAKFHQA